MKIGFNPSIFNNTSPFKSQKKRSILFGKKAGIRDLFMNDLLPSVKLDIYGIPLSKSTCTREHIIPKSLGGSSANKNIALADKFLNNKRGNAPLNQFTTLENVVTYLLQFVGIKVKKGNFNGDTYIKELLPSLKDQGFKQIDKYI